MRLAGLRDELVMRVEGEVVEKDRFTQALQARFKDICRLDLNRVEFVPAGTIPQGAKVVVDERKWE